MNPALKDILLDLEAFTGANASIKLLVSRVLINLLLNNTDLPKVEAIQVKSISKETIEFIIQTNIPLHRENKIRLRLLREVNLPELSISAVIVSGLNRFQRVIINQVAGEKVTIEKKRIIIHLKTFIQPDSDINRYLPLIKKLAIETSDDRVIINVNLAID